MTTRHFIVTSLLACLLGGAAFELTSYRLSARESDASNRADLVIECKGTVDGWYFRHEGPDGKLHTRDDSVSHNRLLLPPHRTVHFQLKSDDYLFRLAQNELHLNTVAVPSVQMNATIETGEPGVYQLESQTMCGTPYLHLFVPPQLVVSEE